jgi:hypothetical protein
MKSILTRHSVGLLFLAFGWIAFLGFLPLEGKASDEVAGFSLRFFGSGVGDIDRVKISIDPHNPIDVGGTDFTLEWWMKADPGENEAQVQCETDDGWITGNILLDRDIWGVGDWGDYGVALNQGAIAFGVNRQGEGNTVCGSTIVADGSWHHVAVTRQVGSGEIQIFVDGFLDGSGSGPASDISYRDGRAASYRNDPYLVIGAEKHDAGAEYPSYSGWIDELRISTTIRYKAPFIPPHQPFLPDEFTAALFHFDEGPEGPCQGNVLNASELEDAIAGQCRFGGPGVQGPVVDADTPFISMQLEATADTETPSPTASPQESTDTSTPTIESTSTATAVFQLAEATQTTQPTEVATPTILLADSERISDFPVILLSTGIMIVFTFLVVYGVLRVKKVKAK